MLRQKRFWIGVIISVVLLAVLFYQTDTAKIAQALAQAQYIYLIPALVLYFIGVGVRAVRWHFLLRSIKPIASRVLFPIVVIGYMANDLLPARLGEVVRAFILGQREGISKAAALVTIFVERVFDGLTMLTFIAAASLFLTLDPYLKTLLNFGVIIFLGIILALILIAAMPTRIDQLVHWILARLPARWGEPLGKLARSFIHGLSVLRSPLDSLAVYALSIVAWLFEVSMYVVLAWGFGIFKPFAVFVLTAAVANLATIAPSTPAYLGVFDAPVKYVLIPFGVNENLATSYTIVLHAALVIPVTLLGFYFAARLGLTLGELSRAKVEAEPVAESDLKSKI